MHIALVGGRMVGFRVCVGGIETVCRRRWLRDAEGGGLGAFSVVEIPLGINCTLCSLGSVLVRIMPQCSGQMGLWW